MKLTEDEADAALMKEAGLSLAEVSGLTLYWKWLLMGYKEPRMPYQSNRAKQFIRLDAPIIKTSDGWNVTG